MMMIMLLLCCAAVEKGPGEGPTEEGEHGHAKKTRRAAR